MAELILTDEELAADTWFELDDATIGKIVKKAAAVIRDVETQGDRIRAHAGALVLVDHANKLNATTMSFRCEGMTKSGVAIGDWLVTVKRTVAP